MFKTLALGLILTSASALSNTHYPEYTSSVSENNVGIGEIPTEEVTFTFMADVKKIYPSLNTVAYKNVRFLSSDEIEYRVSNGYKSNLCNFLGHGAFNKNFYTYSEYVEGDIFRIYLNTEGNNFSFSVKYGNYHTIKDLSCDIE